MMKWTAVDGISSAYIRTMQTACITTLLVACFYANSAAANSISPLFTHNLAYQSADAYTRPPVRIVAHPGPYICSDLNGSYYGESYNTFWKRWDVTCVDSPNHPPGTTYGGGFYSEIRECPPGYALWGSLCQPNDTPQELGKDKGRPSECAGNPVDLSTGRKYQVQVDYENPINPLLRFERIYSLYAYTSDYEPKNIFNAASFPLDPFKWSHTYSRYLKFFTSNTTGETEYVSAHRHDFSVLRFDRDPQTGEWKSPFPDITEVIRKIDVGGEMQWEYVATSGAVETYDSEGRLVRMADHGKSVDLQHTDSSLTVTDNFGRTLIIHHGGPNDTLIQSLTLPGGESVAYSYVTVDNKKRLDSVTYADGTGFRYQYTTGLSAILDLNGVELSSWQYDSAWPTRVVQSLKGGVEDYSFAYSSGFEQPTIEPVPTVTVTSPSGKGTTYAFEYVQGERKLVRVDGLPSANCLATTRSITYDQDGNIASRTDNEGNVTNFVRDTLGRVIQRTDAVGMASERTVAVTWDGTHEWPATISDGIVQRANIYDSNGNILSTTLTDLGTGASKQWTMTYNGDGQVLTLDGPRTDVADTTSYAYDGSGNLASVTDANGKVTLYSGHNAHGQPQTVEDPNGRVTSIAYDARQRVASLVADGVTTTLSYDSLGNLLGVTRSTGTSFTYQYDSARRLVSVTNAIGHRWELVRDSASGDIVSIRFVDDVGAVGFVKNLANDELGRVIAISDSLGNSSTFSYNLNGNLIETTDALSRSSASSYDALNRLIGIVDPAQGEITFAFDSRDNLVAVADPRGNTTTYAHNGFDEKISQVSPETGTTAYVFDDAGNVVGMTDARGIAVDYAYDVLNRLISASYPDPNLDATFAYDAGPHGIGHLSSVQDAAGVTTYSYDIRGNLLSESRTGNTGVETVTSYHYDAEGRLIGMTYPSGREVNYTLDLAGNVVQINTLFDGQTDNLADNIQHLPFGPMTALDYGNGLSLSRAFDQTYRLLNQSIVGVLDLDYSFDPVGNLVGVADHFDGTRSQTIDYDLLDRVIDASGPYGNLSFSYDESGNRLTKTSGIGVDAYVYSPTSNRLEEIAGATSELFGYDENGNVTASAAGEYTYDDSNRLVAFSTAGIDATYQYNADGERVTKTVNGVVTRFRYAEGLLIGEYDVDGNPIREYAYLDGQPLAVFMYESGAIGQLVDRTVDNTVAMLDGAWSSSTSVSGFVGTEYLYHAPALNNPDRVVVDNGDPDFSSTGAWTGSTAVSGYEGGDYLYHPANAGPSGGVIVDDLGAGVATTGQWNQSTSVGGYIGSGYSHHAAGTGTSSVTWPVAQAQSGQYDVYARWTSHANRASNAKYTVLHSGGATDVTVDQRQNGGQWVLLGSFTLDANSQVTLTDEGDGYVVADGIQVVPVGAPANLAQWDLPVATAGTYRVYARWTSHSNRASNATYVVTDTLGETSIAVDQRTNGGQWNLLGVFNLDASSRVVVSDVADGNVIADAVMIEPVASVTTPYVASWPIDAIPGQYEVFARWTSHPNRASNATYTVHHAGGQTAISVDQRQGGGQWQSLGSYELNGSSVVSVDTDVDGYVIADAVRIVGSMPSPQSSTTYYVHNNPLGAAEKMTDAAGYVVWDVDRAPFGEINLISSAVDLPLRFPGQYFDDETGLHYNYFRDYDPSTGRYIQSDPIGLVGGLNTYAYVGGNPLRHVDLYGLEKLNLFSPSDRIWRRAELVSDVDGLLQVQSHGDPRMIQDDRNGIDRRVSLNASDLAELIQNSGQWQPGMPIKLNSCHTGQGDNSIAENLAKELGVPVSAPTGYSIYLPTGYLDTGYFPYIPIGGGYRDFNP